MHSVISDIKAMFFADRIRLSNIQYLDGSIQNVRWHVKPNFLKTYSFFTLFLFLFFS